MDRKFKFTKTKLDKLPTPEKNQVRYSDTESNGLVIRVTAAGNKVFYLYKWANNKPTQIKIGKYPEVTIQQARKQANVLNGDLAKGIDIAAEKKKSLTKGRTLKNAFDDYIDPKNKKFKEITVKDYKRAIKWGVSDWLEKPLVDITDAMVEKRHKDLGKRSLARANNCMRVLRAVFHREIKLAGRRGDISLRLNPIEILDIKKHWYEIKRKDSILKNYQIKPWLKSVKSLNSETHPVLAKTASDYFQFLLFTGLRSTECATMLWGNVDLKEKTFKLIDTKNHTTVEFPLTTYTYNILEDRYKSNDKSKYVFSSNLGDQPLSEYRTWVYKVRNLSGINFNPHDLRRTFTTIGESLDLSIVTVKRLANHKTVERDVTSGYIIRDVERLRDAAQQITNRILELSI